jgi:predicted HAD superfamily Cof-like phosphohydrolase
MFETDFHKVLQFNKAFGVESHSKPNLQIFDNNPKLVEYRLSLVKEEFQELVDAISNKDFNETIDALTDIQYVVLGFYSALGIDADKAFEIVHSSNMSKLCKTEEEAQKSVSCYLEESPQRYDSPSYRRADDDVHWVVYNASTNKILKSWKYTQANFNSIISSEKIE